MLQSSVENTHIYHSIYFSLLPSVRFRALHLIVTRRSFYKNNQTTTKTTTRLAHQISSVDFFPTILISLKAPAPGSDGSSSYSRMY